MTIYQPAEDSYFLSDILKKEIPRILEQNPNLTFLEIGSGSGIHLETAYNLGIKKENIFSCDIDFASVSHCNLLGFHCIKSDLFQNIKGGFDIIIFNPPYLSEDAREPEDSKTATTGGEKGSEIINRFLKSAKEHLNKGGKIFLLISSLTKGIDFGDYNKEYLGNERLFYEELFVWELTLNH